MKEPENEQEPKKPSSGYSVPLSSPAALRAMLTVSWQMGVIPTKELGESTTSEQKD